MTQPLEDVRLRWTLICSRVRRDDLLSAMDGGLAELGKRDRKLPPHPDTLAAMVEYATGLLEDNSLTLAMLRAVHTYEQSLAGHELSSPIPVGYMSAIIQDRPTTPTPAADRKSESELNDAAEGRYAKKRRLVPLLVLVLILLVLLGVAGYFLFMRK